MLGSFPPSSGFLWALTRCQLFGLVDKLRPPADKLFSSEPAFQTKPERRDCQKLSNRLELLGPHTSTGPQTPRPHFPGPRMCLPRVGPGRCRVIRISCFLRKQIKPSHSQGNASAGNNNQLPNQLPNQPESKFSAGLLVLRRTPPLANERKTRCCSGKSRPLSTWESRVSAWVITARFTVRNRPDHNSPSLPEYL